jgi:hypothetical protein
VIFPSGFPTRTLSVFLCLKGAIHSLLNWAILLCDVVPDGKSQSTAQFWQAIAQASELPFPVVFHTENCAVHSGNPAVSSVYLPTPRWRHLKALSSFSKWARHDIFLLKYRFLLHILGFLSSFRITLRPTCLANSKRQPWFYPPQSHAQEDTELTKKLTNLMGKLCCAREHSVQFFRAVFFTQLKTAQFNLERMGFFRSHSLLHSAPNALQGNGQGCHLCCHKLIYEWVPTAPYSPLKQLTDTWRHSDVVTFRSAFCSRWASKWCEVDCK